MNFKKTVVAILAAAVVLPASAGIYSCAGTVTTFGQGVSSADTRIALSIGTGPAVYVCSIDAKGSFTMTVAGCTAAVGQLAAAKAAGMSVEIYFNNSYTCATMPAGYVATDAFWVNGPN